MKPATDLLAAAHEAFKALDASLDATQRSWLEQLPLARGVEALDAKPIGAPVISVPAELPILIEELTTIGGEAWRDRYLRLLVLALLIRTLTRPIPYVLPPSIEGPLNAERRRIVERAPAADAEPYNLDGAFVRDWGFCLGTVLPFGIVAGHLEASLDRDKLARSGLERLREKPWLSLHLDLRPERGRFATETRDFSGAHIADFVRHNPSYQGIFGVGWLSDPVVSEISPHHTATHRHISESGGISLRLDSADGASVRLATGTSRTRRRLYEEGRYRPTDYMTIWPRDVVVRWHEDAFQQPAQSP
jgi:hypothetical protein